MSDFPGIRVIEVVRYCVVLGTKPLQEQQVLFFFFFKDLFIYYM
jgi:hypothetical protein